MLLWKGFHPLCMLMFILAASSLDFALSRPVEATMKGPLYANSRWIVNENGRRVKLACINWPSHLQPVLAEGLHKQPVDKIISKIQSMGFNCVRFTWPVELAINDTLRSQTVTESFTNLGLLQALDGIKANNPWATNLTLIDAFTVMIKNFERNNVMVILDNHLTIPGWCCGLNDGNGFFGDKYFDPTLWTNGLRKMATLATQFPNVIGMSLRNELRGPNSNVDNWYKYMQLGAEAVHEMNPKVLVILSGLNYDKDLSFLHAKPVNVSFTRKVVFELHWYSFSNSGSWLGENLNDVCGRISGQMMDNAGFLAETGVAPLFVSEFGANGVNDNGADTRFLSCFMAIAAEQDWDFAVWTLQGSYYLRENMTDMDEYYGLLDHNWADVRNMTILNKLSSIQAPFRGPQVGRSSTHTILFHPLTGLCVAKEQNEKPLRLGPCKDAASWVYTLEGTLWTGGNHRSRFLQADGNQNPVKFGPAKYGSQWNLVARTKLHLSTYFKGDNTTLCLDTDQSGNLITTACKCLQYDRLCDPTSQWFKMVQSSAR